MADWKNITKVQVGGMLRFMSVGYVNMGEGLLVGAEMPQRQLHHHATWVACDMTWVTAHQMGKSGAPCPTCWPLNRLACVSASSGS